MTHWYNEYDADACDTLRLEMSRGRLPHGTIDSRSIADVRPSDLVGYSHCHFFAGIGGAGLAWRIAGLPDDGFLDTLVKTWYPPVSGSLYSQQESHMAGKLKKLTEDQVVESRKMYEGGASIQLIAQYYGVSRQAMWELLTSRGTKMRSNKKFAGENHFYRGGKRADGHAQNMVEYAVRAGLIERKTTCEQCGGSGQFKDGRNKVQAHHDDYNKPLEVRWLCQECHHEWHKHHKAKRKEARKGPASTGTVWTGGFP